MRPIGLSSAMTSKKTRGKLIFLATLAKSRTNVRKDGRLGRAVARKWLVWLKVESIDSRQIDLNAISYARSLRKSTLLRAILYVYLMQMPSNAFPNKTLLVLAIIM